MIENLLKERILILDGAMGTAIQNFLLEENDFRGQEFENHAFNLKGNNDVLNLTKPEIIAEIHKKYIDAGADIIETNTFNSNALSQQEYGLADLVYRLNFEGAKIAKQQAQNADKQVFVAGSIGPTSKLLSLSPDINRPEFRATDFDFLATTYAEQVSGLIDGGVDILLIETAFDALNVKAALYAVSQVFDNKQVKLPVMVSATVNDRYGHTLTGQSLEAFYNSISHFPLLSFGLNCSFGAEMLMPLIERLHKVIPCYLSIYPNAGLPNEMGHYDETPCFTASVIEKMAQRGLLNIVGGCCGTTPEHISEIKKHLQNIPPRSILHCHCGLDPQSLENKAIPAFAGMTKSLIVSGLENVVIDKKISNFVNIGERTNVAGSAKFARLIREKNYEEAAQIAKNQIENGASIIDINFDDAMLNSAEEMEKFVRYISNDADIAKAALMIDSSDWQTIVAGLKNFQGKSIVNSISLKEGKEVFLQKAREIQRLGAAIIVMAFDEKGQAASFERKIEICRRAYDLLTQKLDFQPYNIIFDVNVLTIGTGIDEHNNYAVDFIEAVRWIKNNLKGALTSGGISNLSFAFRGNNAIREAMHSVFLYHAINAGLDMGIVNPAMLQIYDDIEPNLLQKVENVVLNKTKNATEELLEYASSCHSREGGNPPQNKTFQPTGDSRLRGNDTILAVENRLANALRYGNSEFLADDLREALQKYSSAVEIIEKPLMAAMDKVGELFGEGKMFLPQVIKSAKVMKTAIEILQPEIETQKSAEFSQKRPKIVIATAKGDIHDIGKNILCIMLACNNFEVIDLGIMVENQAVIEAIKLHKPDFVGVSALITPSLSEMADLCQMLENEQFKLPFFVGGAAASAIHTAVKLSPLYSFGVFYGG
ncbi:MAG: methionine synthase, partial [Prevotellaceae bacterium]|nr:methionine synthase [Prevotellaceae bacterium]